ncbi:MAG: hypothetical protein P0S95_06600 [Rhabdochlamydiaceae bacterium]|nr:hypothetical protein [Candidatus Amphrikana amoebophyrae]
MVSIPSRAQAVQFVCQMASCLDVKLQNSVANTMNKVCQFILNQNKFIFSNSNLSRMGSAAQFMTKHYRITAGATAVAAIAISVGVCKAVKAAYNKVMGN